MEIPQQFSGLIETFFLLQKKIEIEKIGFSGGVKCL